MPVNSVNNNLLFPYLKKYIDKTSNDWNYITPNDFYNNYYMNRLKDDTYLLLDIRKKEIFDQYHLKGAKNIFWLDLLKTENLIKLESYRDKIIFLICYVGHTSSQALVLLKLLGFKVISIKFGYGISPVFGVPVAGWLQYNYPVI
jgi:rhodanese-related sulfurtransferase